MNVSAAFPFILFDFEKEKRDIWDLEQNGGISQSFDPLCRESDGVE